MANPGIPHYRRVAAALLASLNDRKDARLPSERALARQYKIARNTARRALNELQAQGYINRLQGSGSYSLRKAPGLIVALGYLSELPHFAQFFRWLRHYFAEKGLQTMMFETGMHGERFQNQKEFLSLVQNAQAVVWMPPSHPVGLRFATRLRRHFPSRLPLVLLGDPLGLALQSSHPFDLVHHDNSNATRLLVALLAREGMSHPVLIRRRDVAVFHVEEAYSGFTSELVRQGISDVGQHVWYLDPDRKSPLQEHFQEKRSWRPSAFILEYPYVDEFYYYCRCASVNIYPEIPVIVLGQENANFRMPINLRRLAEVCSELVTTRLQNPHRSNLRVVINMPVLTRGLRSTSPNVPPGSSMEKPDTDNTGS